MMDAISESDLRDEICRVGASLFERGYVHSTAGNISVRLAPELGGGFLITPTDACLGFLVPGKLARLDDAGNYVSGSRPSKTFALHRCIYELSQRHTAEVGCVIHTHSSNCVALTLAGGRSGEPLPPSGELLPPLTPYFVMKVGRIPVISYQVPGSPKAVDAVRNCFQHYAGQGTHLRGVMLERLGPVVWHQSVAQAMALLEELEETAKLYRSCGPDLQGLNADQLAELCRVFGLTW